LIFLDPATGVDEAARSSGSCASAARTRIAVAFLDVENRDTGRPCTARRGVARIAGASRDVADRTGVASGSERAAGDS